VTDTTTTTVVTTTTTETTATSTSTTTTTTWDGLYRVLITANPSAESHPDQALFMVFNLNSGLNAAASEFVNYADGKYTFLFATPEAGSCCAIALGSNFDTPDYVGAYGSYAGEPLIQAFYVLFTVNIFTLEAGAEYLELTPFTLYPANWAPTLVYTFDADSVADSSGFNFNGTGYDLSYAAGKVNDAASFNGTTSSIEVPDISEGGGTVDFGTLSLWVKPAADADQVIFDASGGGLNGIKIGLYSNGKVFYAHHSNTDPYPTMIITSESAVSAGNWAYITVTRAGDSNEDCTMSLYINGTLEATGIINMPTSPNGNCFKFGCPPGSDDTYPDVTGYYSGLMDEVRYYGQSFGSAEVRRLYQSY
jgi:hypothetical protein